MDKNKPDSFNNGRVCEKCTLYIIVEKYTYIVIL